MRYLSVCSGIEAASVAWHHLGWTPVGFSEIEPFPAAVLAHRFPNVPNFGDMTKYEQWPLQSGSIDLLVGGTPCQSFSVAGLRKGLEDPRGNLMLTYLAIAARLRPRWIVWENVPGVLSSNGGRDFGTFLGALGELGYGFAYRVLDAQYVRVGRWPRAVPQRRRRVFVVGRLLERGTGDGAAAAEVLALEEGLRRYLEAQSKKGKSSTSDAEGGSRGGCNVSGTIAARFGQSRNNHEECVVQPTAGTLGNRGLRSHTELDGHGAYIPVAQPVPYDLFQITAPVNRQNRKPGDPCHTLARDNAAHAAIAIQGNLVGRETGGPQGVGASTDGAMYTLTKADTHAVAFQLAGDRSDPTVSVSDAAFCLPANSMSDRGQAVAIGTDCYNGAITGDVAATMGTPGSSVNASGPTVMQAVAFKPGQSASAHSIGAQEGVACTLEAGGGGNNKQAVAFDWQSGGDSRGLDPKDTAQLQRCQTPAVHHAMTVRRLSAEECEALQGFSRGWTRIPWRGKPAEECPDGPRYKALGNSMACNCMAWIGERIAAYEQRGRVDPTPAGTAGIAPAGDLNHEGDRHG